MKRKAFKLKNYKHPDLYGKLLGYKIMQLDQKKAEAIVGLTISHKHLSPSGRVHGGVVSGLFDFACGAAVFTTLQENDYCSTVEIKVNYFKPLDQGDRLLVQAQVVFRGKRLCVIHARSYRVQKKNKRLERNPVAMCTATFNIVAGVLNS